nr:unnamed protein product [Callosobruchus chinensis]CAH7761639.1 unnamed protein product [Callosobruchus chinensis]
MQSREKQFDSSVTRP